MRPGRDAAYETGYITLRNSAYALTLSVLARKKCLDRDLQAFQFSLSPTAFINTKGGIFLK